MSSVLNSIFIALLSSILLASCSSEPRIHSSEPETVKVEVYSPQGELLLTAALEVVKSPAQRAKGLMFRDSLPDDGGMIFVFPQEASYRFWMKNTQIPLDMLFISKEMKVVEIVENAIPFSEEARGGNVESLYVIEVNGGLARTHGIKEGAQIVLDRDLKTDR